MTPPLHLHPKPFANCGSLCLGILALVLAAPNPAPGQSKNELIPLRLKKMKRTDRLPEGVKETPSVSNLDLPLSLPVSEAGAQWPGEQFSILAQRRMGEILTSESEADLSSRLDPNFVCSELEHDRSPQNLSSGLTLWSGSGGKTIPIKTDEAFRRFHSIGKTKIKIVEVEDHSTRFHVEANRDGAEYSATWECVWSKDPLPRLVSLKISRFETVFSKGPWFIDATRSVIGDSPRFEAQTLLGIDHWARRITRIGDLALTGHHGLAVGDVNGDGLEDLYVCDGGSLPNQLYLQQKDGTAREAAAEWGVDWLEDSRSALLIDLDNDGDQDLIVATIAMIAFAENLDNESFQLRGGFPGAPYPFSLSAADYDSDGDLDLYACVYSAGDDSVSGKRGFEASSPVPFEDANNGGRNVLLENLGEFTFADSTKESGLEEHNTRWSFAASWEDYDRDGDPDLYVANDFGRNCLYRNDGGKFTEVAAASKVEDIGAGMSVSWGDFNRDGRADLLVGNMFSSAGQRVAGQRNYGEERTRMARGNALFAGAKEGFRDVSLESGITTGGWAWSSGFVDLDNDGWQDLVTTNGYLSNTRDDDL